MTIITNPIRKCVLLLSYSIAKYIYIYIYIILQILGKYRLLKPWLSLGFVRKTPKRKNKIIRSVIIEFFINRKIPLLEINKSRKSFNYHFNGNCLVETSCL
ncbi:hypothetical protein MOSE0_I02146 [Monosporozyma servazzii]